LRPQPPNNPQAQQAPGAAGFNNQTVRMIARTSIGGQRLRSKVENAFGAQPVTIGAAHIALRAKDSEIVAGSDRGDHVQRQGGLHFEPRRGARERSGGPQSAGAGRSGGEVCTSPWRPVRRRIMVRDCTPLTFPKKAIRRASRPGGRHHVAFLYYLAAIDVGAPADARALVTFGDSITDGTASTRIATIVPALLAARPGEE